MSMAKRMAKPPVATAWPQSVRPIQGRPSSTPTSLGAPQAQGQQPLVPPTQRSPVSTLAVPVPGSVPVYSISTPHHQTPIHSRTNSQHSAVSPISIREELKIESPTMPEKVMPLAEPLLKAEKGEVAKVTLDLESGLCQPQEAEEVPEWSGWAWVRSLTLLLAGVVLWIYPERWASVFLLLMALVLSPYLGVSLRGGLALPHVGMRRVIASWLLDFIFGIGSAIKEQEKTWKPKLDEALAADSDLSKGINEYALRIAGNLGQAVLEEKSEWIPPMVDAVGDIVPPALSRVMEKKDDWTPALTTMVGEIVPSVMKGVLSNHHTWSPALMQLVGDVVPPVLSAVLKNREWTPALLEFVGEVVPVVIAVVLQRPELPPAIAGFIDGAGPSLAPAVVRLIDHIIMDPKLMESIRKMTDDSMRDEALVKNIKDVIESSLKEGTMYRAVGHGVLKAAGQSLEGRLEHMHQKFSSHSHS